MKKKIKTVAGLEKLSGNKSGTGRNKMPAKKKPAEKQEPKGPDANTVLLVQAQERANKANLMMVASLSEQIAAIQQASPVPVTEWIIDVISRDKDDRIKTVKITTPQNTLN